MNKESKLNLNASNYAISHCDSGKTYNGLEVHKMICDAYIAGNNDNDKDEKIRKALINVFATHKDYEMFFGVSVKDILAWLEKQNHDGINEVLQNPQKCGLEKQGKYETIWKPTKEQLEALEHFVRSVGESGYASPYDNNTKLLYSLLTDLQILKQHGEQVFNNYTKTCKGEQKEINLVDILKHYPNETELYSPLYGQLWLAEVDEKNGVITCYKNHLDDGCTRAVLEQEETVSFYSNGTTGLPDFNVSKDCMLFLYAPEKQGEQKHVNDTDEDIVEAVKGTSILDLVEPKFHEGNWVVQKNTGVYKVIEICKSWYEVIDFEDNHYSISFDKEHMCHLWSINDAKDGDVLACNGSIFIFEEEYMAGKSTAYCGLINGVFHVSSLGCWTNEKCYPATKEQQDLLFSKMKASGWSWNPTTKELSQSRVTKISDKDKIAADIIAIKALKHNTANDSYCKENCKGYQETGKCYADWDCEAKRKADVVKPIFKVGDEVYNRFDKSLAHVIIEYVDESTYYGDTTNFDIIDQDQWGIVRSCENCKCGHYDYPTVSCYLHEDCGGDEPIIIHDDDFVETAMNCKEFEQEN